MRLFAAAFFSVAAYAQIADLAVTNARIFTVNPRQPTASALAVSHGRLIAVSNDVRRFIGPKTKVIDARGATIVPGLIDSHGHMRELGEALETLDLRGITSEKEIADKVRAAANDARPGQWIKGYAWDQNLWATKQFPSSVSITEAAPSNPVVLSRVDGHALWVNDRAIQLADITPATIDPAGGRILRDANGKPTGVLLDNAQSLIEKRIPVATPEQIEQRLRRALAECARVGLTGVDDAGVDAGDIAAYRRLAAAGALTARIYAMIGGPGTYADQWLSRKPEIGNYLTIRSIKLYADGALGSRGAALLQPYSDDATNTGIIRTERAVIERIAKKAVAHGFQLNTHAIGDGGNRMVLEAYGAALKGANDKRFRVEHAQVIAPADFSLFRKFSIIASMQPTHATSDMPWAADRLGPERVKGAYAWQTLMHHGVHVPAGSDFPVESPNPLWGFYAAVTRQDKDRNPAGGWYPEQRMSREEALRAFTIEGAYATFTEHVRGSLEPGKFADFVILSADMMTVPAEQLRDVRAAKTVVGGKVVYSE